MATWLDRQSEADRFDVSAMLRRRAGERPSQAAFTYLGDDLEEEASLTYGELDRRARAIAARLQALDAQGERVLLAFPAGLKFIEALFGCFYAGCIAVPTSLPYRRHRLQRFESIIHSAAPRVALTTASAAKQTIAADADGNGHAGAVHRLPWLAVDEIEAHWSERWIEPTIDLESPAMLQYTSGSTSEPKGVMLSHANLEHNARAICNAFAVKPGPADDAAEVGVLWLPTYHDMGLIGGVIVPVYGTVKIVSMSPTTFLQNPLAWLEVISRYKATLSGGPNFAYDLCARKVTERERASLDLSNWRLAFVGAEPVQAETLERFAEAFSPCGFKPESFYPCYGLAEATLMVTGSSRGQGVKVYGPTTNRVTRVSCGRPVDGMRVAIVHPKKRTPLSAGEVGEVWVSGPSVGQGYWCDDSMAPSAFDARLVDGPAYDDDVTPATAFLRTGDLGFMHDGELFITGRRDDVIVIRGVNYYPQDIEATARLSHPLLEAHGGAAFAVEHETGPRHVLVHEVTRNGDDELDAVIKAAFMAVSESHDLALDDVVLVRAGSIPRTSSGKIQRKATRKAYLAGKLFVLAERSVDTDEAKCAAESTSTSSTTSADSSTAFAAVCEHARGLSRLPLAALTPQTPITELGLDSLQRVELVTLLERRFGGRLPDVSDVRSLGELAEVVQTSLIDATSNGEASRETAPEHCDVDRFPEIAELEQHERRLHEAIGTSPYFRIDEGGVERAGHMRVDGRELVNFCAYDYLGMSREPEVAEAVASAVQRYGTSASASRLVSGEKRIHRELEEHLADFLGTEDALAFVSGFATNVSVIGHLLGADDLIVHDMLAHNSIIQGARMAGARRMSFAHQDWEALDALLSEVRQKYRRVLIAIEGVYSMDGDWPELPRVIEVKQKHRALLLIDEAHSLGTLGQTGRGLGEQYAVDRSAVDIWMGTLSKSLASCGGFIAGSAKLVKYLKHTAPGFVYSVGLSPPNAAAALASLKLLKQQPQRVEQLRERAGLFLDLARQRGLDTGLAAGSPVVPIVLGSSADSLRVSQALFERGINVQPILSPAVPEDATRLRFFITINHSHAQIRAAVEAAGEALEQLKQGRQPQET